MKRREVPLDAMVAVLSTVDLESTPDLVAFAAKLLNEMARRGWVTVRIGHAQQDTEQAREFAEGTRMYPGSFRGLAGEPSGGGRMLAPFGVRYADPVDGRYLKGGEVKSFYCHHYRQPNEHYHASLEDQHKCPA